jgi:WD40 repeat protein/tRNA A-37 threonylcarbamoyl transferase component Bud32
VPGYEILGALGQGGMGVVYKARQEALGRVVALKMILHAEHAGPDARQRFQAEAEAVARLQHPHIVQVYEVGEHHGLPFFSLEYCPGGSLADQLDGIPWEPARAAALVQTLARAMHAAHQAQVIHRDLKPANVLLAEGGTPKVTDFGLAKRLDIQGATQTGAVVGTPSYMAPEQAGGHKDVGPAADTYALGAILYELLTGRPPFKAATPLDTLLQVLSEEPVAVRRLQPGVPRDLETICHKCLEREARKRYASALDLADDLRRWEAGEPIRARPVGRLERAWKWARRKPAAAALLGVSAAAALLLAGVVAWFLTVLYERNRKLEETGGQLVQERDKAREEEGNAQQSAQREKEKEAEAVRLLDRTRRMRMTTQLLKVAAIYRQNPVQALKLLEDPDPCPPGFRDDFAWRYYYSQCQRWRLRWEWPKDAIDALAVSPDGKLLATSKGKVITLWELNTGARVTTLEGHTRTVRRLRFAPGSRLLASGAQNPGDVDRGWIIDRRRGTASPGSGSPDSVPAPAPGPERPPVRRSAGGDERGAPPPAVIPVVRAATEIKLWDVSRSKACFEFTATEGELASVTFSADGKTLAAGYYPKAARVWDVDSGRDLAHLPEVGSYVALSSDGKLIVAGVPEQWGAPLKNAESRLEVWDVGKKQRVQTFSLKDEMARSGVNVAFTADGKEVAAAGRGLHLLDMGTGKDQHLTSRVPVAETGSGMLRGLPFGEHTEPLERRHLTIAPDGKALATLVAMQSNVVVWDAEGRQERVAIQGTPGEVEDVSFTDGGKGLAVVQRGKSSNASERGATTLRVWSLVARPEHLILAGARGVAFLPDGKGFVTAVGDKLKRVDPDTAGEEVLAEGLEVPSLAFAASSDGTAVAVASLEGKNTITVWDVASRRPRFKLEGLIFSFRFYPDGTRIVLWQEDGVKLFDAKTGAQTRRVLPGRNDFSLAAFDPEGKTLATGGAGTLLQLWDLQTGAERRTLSKPLIPLHFLPEENLVVWERPGDVKLWDLRKDQEKASLRRTDYASFALSFAALTPDGKALGIPGADLEVWDLATAQARLKLPATDVGMLAFSPDSRFLAFAGLRPAEVRVWDTRPIKEVIRPGR